MLLKIKLFGGMECKNEQLPSCGLSRFELEVLKGMPLKELLNLLKLGRNNLVSIVNGKAQTADFELNEECTVSIFLPMGNREYDFLGQIK